MAIYTQYGRYLKAKLFKKELTETNDVYMCLGTGRFSWGTSSPPATPYDSAHFLGSVGNLFYDNGINQTFIINDASNWPWQEKWKIMLSLGYTYDYLNKCKYLLPPFPAWWPIPDGALSNSITPADSYPYCYITENQGNYSLINTYTGTDPTPISIPTNEVDAQIFSELYLRGLAILANHSAPVGLLGAVKCIVEFVKDIGNSYTGGSNQFWYGDRYWEIVNPQDISVNQDLGDEDGAIYPHHLLISALINPRQLCDSLEIDKHIVPRHIAIYTKAKSQNNQIQYRVGEYEFNFGQLDAEQNPSPNRLNFTLPCTYQDSGSVTHTTPSGEFKFLLNDYIRGAVRDPHSVDRIGYIIGF